MNLSVTSADESRLEKGHKPLVFSFDFTISTQHLNSQNYFIDNRAKCLKIYVSTTYVEIERPKW